MNLPLMLIFITWATLTIIGLSGYKIKKHNLFIPAYILSTILLTLTTIRVS